MHCLSSLAALRGGMSEVQRQGLPPPPPPTCRQSAGRKQGLGGISMRWQYDVAWCYMVRLWVCGGWLAGSLAGTPVHHA